MRFLVDTHTFLWLSSNSPRLSLDIQETLADPEHDVFFSSASAWEIAIMAGLGKLAVPADLAAWLPRQLAASGLIALPISLEHAVAVASLPRHHRDPFDRLLIAQAIVEDMTLVTADHQFERYDVRLIRC